MVTLFVEAYMIAIWVIDVLLQNIINKWSCSFVCNSFPYFSTDSFCQYLDYVLSRIIRKKTRAYRSYITDSFKTIGVLVCELSAHLFYFLPLTVWTK